MKTITNTKPEFSNVFSVDEILGFKDKEKDKDRARFLHYAIETYFVYKATELVLKETNEEQAKNIAFPILDRSVLLFILNIFDLPLSQEDTRNKVSEYLWERYQKYLPPLAVGKYTRTLGFMSKDTKFKNRKVLKNRVLKHLKNKLILEKFAFEMFCKELVRDDIEIKSLIGDAFEDISDKLGLDIDTGAEIWRNISFNLIKFDKSFEPKI